MKNEKARAVSHRSLLKTAAAVLALPALLSAHPVSAMDTQAPLAAAQFFPLSDVRLQGGPFKAAQEIDHAYLLRLAPDRLLSHLRKNAGLAPKAAPYGGWDKDGASTVGHYLSACSQMWAATGDGLLKKRVDYVVSEMADCQKAAGDGGIYAFAWDRNVWFDKLRQGEVLGTNVNAWYLTHKILAGLRDAYLQAGNTQAREVLVRMTDWAINITAKLSDTQWQKMLDAEHGGPHEIFADVYAMTGKPQYLELAEKFRHRKVFDPLAKNSDTVLNGLHANTQVPKFIGYERIYELNGDKTTHAAAQHFWKSVARNRSWANGGNSQWEAFFTPSRFAEEIRETCGPETCNTYNMLKLTEQLWSLAPSANYMHYAESALYNHILPSEASKGGFNYYTSMRPGHYRIFSRDEDAFWCCVGTGMENHARYGSFIYAHGADDLYVNLFVPSEVTWKAKSLTLRQETTFPEKSSSRLVLSLAKPQMLTLKIRRPDWVIPNGFTLRINDKPITATNSPNGYATVRRLWKNGDHIDVTLPMHIRAISLPQSTAYAAFQYGPVLLAGALGAQDLKLEDFYGGGPNVAPYPQLAQRMRPSYEAPAIVGTQANAASHLATVSRSPLTFQLSTATGSVVTLRPFYTIHYERYSIYFPLLSAAQALVLKRDKTAGQRETATLEARTIDRVRVGEADSEKAHAFVGTDSQKGVSNTNTAGTHWRDAKDNFRYKLAVGQDGTNTLLRCTYWGSDKGRSFNIVIDGKVIATQELKGDHPDDYVPITYVLPAELTQGKTRITVEFRAKPGSIAGGVLDVRTVRPLPPEIAPQSAV